MRVRSPFPVSRLAAAVTRKAPVEGTSAKKLALESVTSWTGQLVDDVWVESSDSGSAFDEGDLLFGKLRPYLAKTWVADEPGSYVGDFLRLVPREGWVAEYLGYVLRSVEFVRAASAESTGSKMPRTEWERLKNLRIPAPSTDEQQAIANFLDRETAEIDAFIADQERLIELLTERRLNSILELTGAAQVMTVRGSAESTRLGSLFSVQLGKMLDGGKAPRTGEFINGYLRASNVKQGRLDLADVKSMPFSSEERRLYSLLKDDLLVVEGGATSGASTVLDRDIPEYAFQKTLNRVRRIDPREANDTSFLALTLEGFKALGLVDVLCNQSTMPHLTAEKLRSIRLPWPSRETRLRVIDECKELNTEIDAAIADAREAIALSKERRAALISAAVTGKIDVRA